MSTYTQILYHQEVHHRNETFKEEMKRLLQEHGIVYDEKYLL